MRGREDYRHRRESRSQDCGSMRVVPNALANCRPFGLIRSMGDERGKKPPSVGVDEGELPRGEAMRETQLLSRGRQPKNAEPRLATCTGTRATFRCGHLHAARSVIVRHGSATQTVVL
jgi:hypothetical protein